MNTVRSPRYRRWPALLLVAAVLALPLALTAGGTEAQSLGGSVQIGLKNLKFTPDKVTAKVNQNITFVWKEKVTHNVAFAKNGPKSKLQSSGVFVVKFAKPGVYKYTCTIHPGMKGQVTVK